jgi:glutamate N-acetyltransferase/amino-acid N-acetyltransferase
MAKGAGMIHPDLATMIAVITTDACLAPAALERMLRRVVDRTFHCMTVDGDTSTNDMVAILANGASGAKAEGRWSAWFEKGLTRVCEALAKSIARDGEGATKFVEILVAGASSVADARRVGKSIARSPLVKTALYGEEPNWGRIVCAAGASGVSLDPSRLSVRICGIPVFRRGEPVSLHKRQARQLLRTADVRIVLDLAAGDKAATVWTCDLSREYIDINAGYMS